MSKKEITMEEALTAALGHAQQIYRAMSELSDLTQDMDAGTQQQDAVTLRLYLKLRAEPLSRAWEHKRQLRRLCSSLPDEQGERLLALLEGSAEDPSPAERPLLEQVQRNQALLSRLIAVDQRISLRMGRDRSFYQKAPR